MIELFAGTSRMARAMAEVSTEQGLDLQIESYEILRSKAEDLLADAAWCEGNGCMVMHGVSFGLLLFVFSFSAFFLSFAMCTYVQSQENQQCLLERVRTGKVLGLFVGLDCRTWSRARRGKPPLPGKPRRGWPLPLRSDDHLWGLPGLQGADLRKVQA